MATCQSCNRRISGTVHHSITGRELCDACNTQLLGQTAGIITGGPTLEGQIASAVATAGWLARVKARRTSRER